MSKNNRIIIHIGTHKTGSTSIQEAFFSNRIRLLEKHNIAVYEGSFEKGNHIELHVSAMRDDRSSFSKEKMRIHSISEFRENTEKRIRKFQAENPDRDHFYSTEGLSLLRFGEEIEYLKNLLGREGYKFLIVLIVRDKKEFLESYRRQIEKSPGRTVSKDPESHLFVEPNSWLANYEEIIDLWSRYFSSSQIRVIDYDEALIADSDILPSFANALSLNRDLFGPPGKYRLNSVTLASRLRQLLAKGRRLLRLKKV